MIIASEPTPLSLRCRRRELAFDVSVAVQVPTIPVHAACCTVRRNALTEYTFGWPAESYRTNGPVETLILESSVTMTSIVLCAASFPPPFASMPSWPSMASKIPMPKADEEVRSRCSGMTEMVLTMSKVSGGEVGGGVKGGGA